MPFLSELSTFGASVVDKVICLLPTLHAASCTSGCPPLLVSPPTVPSNVHYLCLLSNDLEIEIQPKRFPFDIPLMV